MKILAFDFSSAQRSVAVACDGRHVREVIETAKGNSMAPFTMIETALADANVTRHDIQRIVVGLGPGSYTGIRAGIAMAQGWQLAREVELLGISSAEATAVQAHEEGLRGTVTVVIDAQRGEFYLAAWELSDAGLRELEPLHIAGADEANAQAASGRIMVGPEVIRWFANGRTIFPRAAILAKLAMTRPGSAIGGELEPIYLRETTFVKAPPPRVV